MPYLGLQGYSGQLPGGTDQPPRLREVKSVFPSGFDAAVGGHGLAATPPSTPVRCMSRARRLSTAAAAASNAQSGAKGEDWRRSRGCAPPSPWRSLTDLILIWVFCVGPSSSAPALFSQCRSGIMLQAAVVPGAGQWTLAQLGSTAEPGSVQASRLRTA